MRRQAMGPQAHGAVGPLLHDRYGLRRNPPLVGATSHLVHSTSGTLEEIESSRAGEGFAARPSHEERMATVHVEAAKAAMLEAESGRPAGLLMTGTASGLLAGAVMAGVLMLGASSAGMDPLHPMRVIGATFVGPEALKGGMEVVAYGALLHAATSMAVALLFVAIFPVDLRPLEAVVIGPGYAMLVLGIMAGAVVPGVNASFRAEMQPIGGAWVVAHALYGCALALEAGRLAGHRSAGARSRRDDRS